MPIFGKNITKKIGLIYQRKLFTTHFISNQWHVILNSRDSPLKISKKIIKLQIDEIRI